MAKKQHTSVVRRFIINNVQSHPGNIASLVAEQFGISRQAAHRHVARLVEEGALEAHDRTRARTYKLQRTDHLAHVYALDKALEEHVIWEQDVQPVVARASDKSPKSAATA